MRSLGWIAPEELGRAPHTGLRFDSPARVTGRMLLGGLPGIYDQGRVGNCTAQTLAGGVEYLLPLAGYDPERPDRRALYARARQAIGRLAEDSGAMIGDGIAALRRGWEREREVSFEWGPAWTAPPPELGERAPRLVSAEALDFDIATIAWELAAGFPVAVGLRITPAWFESDGDLPPPSGASVGGHAVLLVGFDSERRAWRMRNSWGTSWGDDGEAWLPWSWIAPPWCGEVWSLRAVRRAT